MVRLAGLLVFIGSALYSQVGSSTLTGRVSDASGAAIPGVAIKIVNEDSGSVVNILTNHEGLYTASTLLPGVYRIEAKATGFDPVARTNVALQVAQTVAADFALQV